ncbi:MAG: LysR family transcriptional regulator, partial [Microbacterium sp.]
MLNTHRLRLLLELRRRGTIARVAETLKYDPSSISHQLRMLEKEAGTPVIEPFGRGVRLTDAGEILAEYAVEALEVLERAEAAVTASFTEARGIVRIATFLTAAHTFVLDAVLTLRRELPLLDLRITHLAAEDALQSLASHDFDIAVIEEFPSDPAVVMGRTARRLLMTDAMLLVGPPESGEPDIAALADARWAMEPEGTPARAWAVAECRRAGFEPHVAFESSDPFLHARLASAGAAHAFLPAL